MSKAAFSATPRFTLPHGKGPLIVEGDGIEVEFTGGKVVVRSGEVELGAQARLATTASPVDTEVSPVMFP